MRGAQTVTHSQEGMHIAKGLNLKLTFVCYKLKQWFTFELHNNSQIRYDNMVKLPVMFLHECAFDVQCLICNYPEFRSRGDLFKKPQIGVFRFQFATVNKGLFYDFVVSYPYVPTNLYILCKYDHLCYSKRYLDIVLDCFL